MMMAVSVSQQYLLASKARSKLMRCANTGKNKDFDLRVLVGHANLLDRLMGSIDRMSAKDVAVAGAYGVEYFSSDEESDDENKVFSSSDSSSEEEEDQADSSDSDYSDSEGEEDRYVPLGAMGSAGQQRAVVTVTIDQCLAGEDEEYESDSESDVDEQRLEMDLSMMPLTMKSREAVSIGEPIIV